MKKMQSVMNHSFSQIPEVKTPRSQFDRSHGYKTTFDAGYIIPVLVDEALPGDTFTVNMTSFSRLATPLVPLMDNLFLDSFFFAVPLRLVWNNWQKFNGEQTDPDDSTDYLMPTMTSPVGGYLEGSLSDYMGLPTKIAGLEHTSVFHRAYNLIWNEWFRDQNLQDSVVVDKDDGPDSPSDYVLLKRGKRHDYFTSSLPWPQKGPAVPLPLGDSAPVFGTDAQPGIIEQTTSGYTARMAYTTATVGRFIPGTPSTAWVDGQEFNIISKEANIPSNIYADLSDATAATINQLRQAFQIQKMYERDARGGTRYTEIIRSHFGVTSPDARLQRPEYLGGGTTPINIHPVPQTSQALFGGTPQGWLAGYGTASQVNHGFTKSFTEHCIIMGFVCARADLNYQQGLNRMYSRQTRFDFYWPSLAHLGEQSVLNKEIYAQGTSADDDVFGYQERYAEYRYKPSQVTGLFRSNATGSISYWHLSQNFGSLPVLNDEFIEENPPMDRVLAVPTQPDFLFDSFFNMKCARPMPVYSVPGLIDHF